MLETLTTKIMQSLDEMAEKEYEQQMCVYKQASAMAYDKCYVCDGFNYNCESYELQRFMERMSKRKDD